MNKYAIPAALLAAIIAVGCEEKKPATPAAPAPPAGGTRSTTDALKDAADKGAQAVTDTAKQATETAKEAAAAISDKAKEAMSNYLGGLGDAGGVMEKIKSAIDVPGAMGSLSEAAKKVTSNSALLGALPDAEKTAVKDANKDQLGSLTSKFKEQMDRIMKDPTLGKALGDSLKSFKLFE